MPQGALYASPPTSDAPATLIFRAFEAWGANTDWAAPLPAGEQAEALAVGGAFAAAATSARLLRVFTAAGARAPTWCVCGVVVVVCVWKRGGGVAASH